MYHMTEIFHTAVPQNLVLHLEVEERNTRTQPGRHQSRSLVGDLTVRIHNSLLELRKMKQGH